jgi:hypothetical protein
MQEEIDALTMEMNEMNEDYKLMLIQRNEAQEELKDLKKYVAEHPPNDVLEQELIFYKADLTELKLKFIATEKERRRYEIEEKERVTNYKRMLDKVEDLQLTKAEQIRELRVRDMKLYRLQTELNERIKSENFEKLKSSALEEDLVKFKKEASENLKETVEKETQSVREQAISENKAVITNLETRLKASQTENVELTERIVRLKESFSGIMDSNGKQLAIAQERISTLEAEVYKLRMLLLKAGGEVSVGKKHDPEPDAKMLKDIELINETIKEIKETLEKIQKEEEQRTQEREEERVEELKREKEREGREQKEREEKSRRVLEKANQRELVNKKILAVEEMVNNFGGWVQVKRLLNISPFAFYNDLKYLSKLQEFDTEELGKRLEKSLGGIIKKFEGKQKEIREEDAERNEIERKELQKRIESFDKKINKQVKKQAVPLSTATKEAYIANKKEQIRQFREKNNQPYILEVNKVNETKKYFTNSSLSHLEGVFISKEYLNVARKMPYDERMDVEEWQLQKTINSYFINRSDFITCGA